MDRNRGILVVAGSFALLAAGVAVTYLARQQKVASDAAEMKKIEGMIDEYEAYTEAEGIKKPVQKPKAKRPRGTAAKNGHVAPILS